MFQNRFLPRLEQGYDRFLRYALAGRRPWTFFFGTAGLMVLAFVLLGAFPPKVEFFPSNEPQYLNIFITKPIGTDIEETNRVTKFEEWEGFRPQTIFVSATPGPWEMQRTGGVFAEQVVRPTGLIDPECIVRPTTNQVDDIIAESREMAARGNRVLITTLTKKMAEALSEYMYEGGIRVRYLHSDIDTLERIEIMRDLRLGVPAW